MLRSLQGLCTVPGQKSRRHFHPRPRLGVAPTTFVPPPPGINKNTMPFPGSRLLYWPARQVFHNVGSFNWASCQSRVPQVASVLQSGGAAWVGLAAPLSAGGEARHCSGGWQQGGSGHFLGAGQRGPGHPSASLRQPSAEGVKASQPVWLLMIATHLGRVSIRGKPFPSS